MHCLTFFDSFHSILSISQNLLIFWHCKFLPRGTSSKVLKNEKVSKTLVHFHLSAFGHQCWQKSESWRVRGKARGTRFYRMGCQNQRIWYVMIFFLEKKTRGPLSTRYLRVERPPETSSSFGGASQHANCVLRGVQKLPRTAFRSLPTRELRVERGPEEVQNPVCGPLNTQSACWEGSVCRAWPCCLLHWATCSWWLLSKRFALVFTPCGKILQARWR